MFITFFKEELNIQSDEKLVKSIISLLFVMIKASKILSHFLLMEAHHPKTAKTNKKFSIDIDHKNL